MAYNSRKNVIWLSFLLIFLFGFIYVTYSELAKTMVLYMGIIGISIFVYSFADLKTTLSTINYGFTSKDLLSSSIYGIILGVGFYYLTSLIPGFSISIPIVPQSIGSGLRSFVVNFVAPFAETIFVQGAFFGFVKDRVGPKKIYLAIFLQAIFFASLHLAAYVSGFYAYPDLGSGLLALGANVGAFLTAFLFAFVVVYAQIKLKKDIFFVIAFHTAINFLVFTSLSFGLVSY